MTDLTNEQVNENFFKAKGWEYNNARLWAPPEPIEDRPNHFIYGFTGLPNCLDSYTDFKKWCQDMMEGEGCFLTVSDFYIEWVWSPDNRMRYSQKKEKGHILRAAVIAATRYLENKNA